MNNEARDDFSIIIRNFRVVHVSFGDFPKRFPTPMIFLTTSRFTFMVIDLNFHGAGVDFFFILVYYLYNRNQDTFPIISPQLQRNQIKLDYLWMIGVIPPIFHINGMCHIVLQNNDVQTRAHACFGIRNNQLDIDFIS